MIRRNLGVYSPPEAPHHSVFVNGANCYYLIIQIRRAVWDLTNVTKCLLCSYFEKNKQTCAKNYDSFSISCHNWSRGQYQGWVPDLIVAKYLTSISTRWQENRATSQGFARERFSPCHKMSWPALCACRSVRSFQALPSAPGTATKSMKGHASSSLTATKDWLTLTVKPACQVPLSVSPLQVFCWRSIEVAT